MKNILVAVGAGLLVGALALGSIVGTYSYCQSEPRHETVYTQEAEGFQVGITAPTEVKLGDLVILEVTGEAAASYKWKIVPESDNFLVIDNGKRAVFSHGIEGNFMFILAAAKDGDVDVVTHDLRVVGKPSYSGIETKVRQWVRGVNTTKDEAEKLANSFKTVAMVARSGQIRDIEGFIQATKVANQDAIGANLESWAPFRAALNQELTSKHEAGELPDLDAHIQYWIELSEALKAVPFEEGLKDGPAKIPGPSTGDNSRSSSRYSL